MAGCDAMRNMRFYSRSVALIFGMLLYFGSISSDAVGFNLNLIFDARINIKVTEGVVDPKVAAICRKAVKPGVISETATRLGA